MACGKVVLGSSSGSIPELIANPQFIFKESNVRSLSQLLRQTLLLTEEELYELGKTAHRRAVENYSVKKQAALFWELLQKDERERKASRDRDALGFLQGPETAG
jgi:glycosyltransferase involved in cell wall biosynthesis